MPVNMPTHAHGQGYSDLNFLIPELVSGIQFSKGPYFADQGDFATAGATTINYTSKLDRPIARVEGGGQAFSRALLAGSPRLGAGQLVVALEASHNDGPWVRPDDYQKLNGVVRYSAGDNINGFSLTAMGYHGPFARVCADIGVFAGRRRGRELGSAGHPGGYGPDDRGEF